MKDAITYTRMVRAGAAVSAGIGCIALAGWILELPYLASLGQGLIPMAPSTAILFVVYGLAFLLDGRATSGRRTMLFSISVFVTGTLISALLLILSIKGIFLDAEHFSIKTMGAVDGTPIGHMSPITAAGFLLISLSVPAVLLSGPERLWLKKCAWWVAVVIVAVYIMLIFAYLFGTPMFYGGAFIPPAATTSLAFVALGAALSAFSRPLAWPETGSGDRESSDSSRVMIALFLFLVAGIISAGYFYYRNHQKQYLAGIERQLSAVADLKVGELTLWREERLADADFFHDNSAFAELVHNYLHYARKDQAQRDIETWIERIKENHNYNRIILLDAHGKNRLSFPDTAEPVSNFVSQKAADALRTGRITVVDFYRTEAGGKIYLSILVPIFDPHREKEPLGVLVMRIDPEKYLYPFIQRWPTASATAESLLVRKDGDEAVFLNELKFAKNTALDLKIPLKRTEIVAVEAALGREGIVRGIDYRGHPVMAALRSIPDSPWYLVTRMDEEEIFAPMQERFWVTVALISAMLLSAGTGFGFIWRQRSVSDYKRSEQQATRNKERLQHLSSSNRVMSRNCWIMPLAKRLK